MNRTSKSYSVSLALPVADALEQEATAAGLSLGLKIADIVEKFVENSRFLPADAKADLKRLRWLRDTAIEKMEMIRERDGFSADITLRTFDACKADPHWIEEYERYVRGDPLIAGNPRKTNANQTIGSRIKSKLRARDLIDGSGKAQRGRAPTGAIIQTYQLLEID
jgi:hypothetical protein